MARLQQLHLQTRLLHPGVEPLRQRASLQAHPRQLNAQRLEPRDQSLRLAGDLRLTDNPPLRVHNAHARSFQRHVYAGIMLHGRLS